MLHRCLYLAKPLSMKAYSTRSRSKMPTGISPDDDSVLVVEGNSTHHQEDNKMVAEIVTEEDIQTATNPGILEFDIPCQTPPTHKKSKVMVFSQGTQKEKNKYTINNTPLDIVKDYKYLGITLNSKNCSFVQTLSILQVKGTRAMYSLLSHLPLKLLSIKTLLRLFDSCIAPIITYGSELWGPYVNHEYTKWNTNPIERLNMQFLKRILGVNRSTTNELVRAELGRFPILSQVFCNNINYIQSLRQQKDNSTLVKQAFNVHDISP